jgi:hypothetical protein
MGLRWPTIGEHFAFSLSCSRSLASPDAAPRGRGHHLRPPIPPLERRSNNATEVSALQRRDHPRCEGTPHVEVWDQVWDCAATKIIIH